jgi:L-threonylcarbamoyladenylate synthase
VILGGVPRHGEGFLALSNAPTPIGVHRISSPKNVIEFMQVLYASFRQADHMNLSTIRINLPSEEGLWLAIKDRVQKASGGRSSG